MDIQQTLNMSFPLNLKNISPTETQSIIVMRILTFSEYTRVVPVNHALSL